MTCGRRFGGGTSLIPLKSSISFRGATVGGIKVPSQFLKKIRKITLIMRKGTKYIWMKHTALMPQKVPLFDLTLVENNCIYTIYSYVFLILILQFKVWYKAIQDRLKVPQAMATES